MFSILRFFIGAFNDDRRLTGPFDENFDTPPTRAAAKGESITQISNGDGLRVEALEEAGCLDLVDAPRLNLIMAKPTESRKRRILPLLFGSTQWERRGASLIEVMISVAIVVISALAAASFFSDQSATARNVTRRSACQAALDAQLSYFRQSPAAQALGWTQPSSTGPMTPIPANETWFADSIMADPLVGQDVASPETGGVTSGRAFHMNLLQNGSMGILGRLMNQEAGICTNGIDLSSIPHKGTSQFPSGVNGDLLKNFKAKLQIQPYDLSTGAADSSCPRVWARPQGQMDHALATANPKLIDFPADTKSTIGYRVTLKGTYDAPTGSASCSATDDFSYPVDTKLPKASVILNYFDPTVNADSIRPSVAMVPPKARPQCSHTTGQPAALRMEIGFNAATGLGKIEPGTMFLCRDVSQQVNGDYCPGATATGARMHGQNYDGTTSAKWVPCGQVTACGIKPNQETSIFRSNPSTGEQKYVLNYATPSSDQNEPDGLWGCDVKIDVATVDPSGNYTLLSTVPNPLNASTTAEKGKYFQPTECWACYQKKSSLFGAIVGLIAVTLLGGLIGAAIFCAAGGGGICRPNNTKFLGNYCFNKYGSGGSKFCRKVPTQYPQWFGAMPAMCAATTAPYPGHPKMSYSLPKTGDGGVAEDSSVDKNNATFCEAQAICNNGTWEGFPIDGGGTSAIADCGSVYTQHKLSIASLPSFSKPPTSGPPTCFTYVPDSLASRVATYPASYYQAFQACPGYVTGLSQDVLCTYTVRSGRYHATYPNDSRTNTGPNEDPNNYYYQSLDKPLDLTLPECS